MILYMVVNYLSHFLLTEKLAPLLNESNKTKIVQVASLGSFAVAGTDLSPSTAQGNPIASQPGGNTGFTIGRDVRAYGNSKLAQVLHARALSRRNRRWKVVSTCPQWVASEIVAKSTNFVNDWFYQLLAYPCNGYGINSVLKAVLATDEEGDFFTNTHLGCVALLDRIPQLLYTHAPVRDSMIWVVGTMVLLYQRWLPTGKTTTSSMASYNESLQEELYEWSLSEVSPWL